MADQNLPQQQTGGPTPPPPPPPPAPQSPPVPPPPQPQQMPPQVPPAGAPPMPPSYYPQQYAPYPPMPPQYGQQPGAPYPPQPPYGVPMPGMPAQGAPMPSGQQMPPPGPPKPPANFQLGRLLPKELKVKIPQHPLKFDENYFLRLLAGSISLMKDEKIRIIESVPKLKQSQIDELIKIFEEEKRKFAELSEDHVPQLEKLARQHYEDWVDIEMYFSSQQKKAAEASQADELRKKLGI